MRYHFSLFMIVILLVANTPIYATTFSTWAPWEIDSTVTAWYLKRNIIQNAEFTSLPKGTTIEHNTSIDIPDSPYRRSARTTAFDSAIKKHLIESRCTEKLAKIVRLLELAPWRKSTSAEAEAFERSILPLLPKNPSYDGLEQAFDYLDKFCAKENGQQLNKRPSHSVLKQ